MPRRISEPIQIYQLRVTLPGSHPLIWRQIQVRSDITLGKLHRILQVVMGWTGTHLHQFAIRGKQYWIPDEGDMDLRKKIDERKHRLRDVVSRQASRFRYEYDFGDLWTHELLVENILSPQEGVRYPVCLAGARARPPEDIGGTPGYENFLAAINSPRHPEHQEYLDWIGHRFDPEAFDVNEVNRKLHRLK
jgi:Plasmid pRiA4b ORF-3-like protein